MAGGASHLLEMNGRKTLVHRVRRCQPATQLRGRLFGFRRARMTATAGERLDHAQLVFELSLGLFSGVLLAHACHIAAEQFYAQIDHVRCHGAVFHFALVAAHNHVIDAVAMAINE